MALSEDEIWADEKRGRWCAECAESLYRCASIGNKGVGDGDEILAAFQEDFDADVSDDDGDMKCDKETRVQANIRTETGMRLAVLNSAAQNAWYDKGVFAEYDGRDLDPATCGAGGADRSALDAVGTGVVMFSLWGRLMRNIRVQVVRMLPPGILIDSRLMLRLKSWLDFSSGMGSFYTDTSSGPRIFTWRIFHESSVAFEQAEFINEVNLKDAIRELYLQEFGDKEAQKAFRTLLQRYWDFFFGQYVDCALF
jgi:hypothetical protein